MVHTLYVLSRSQANLFAAEFNVAYVVFADSRRLRKIDRAPPTGDTQFSDPLPERDADVPWHPNIVRVHSSKDSNYSWAGGSLLNTALVGLCSIVARLASPEGEKWEAMGTIGEVCQSA